MSRQFGRYRIAALFGLLLAVFFVAAVATSVDAAGIAIANNDSLLFGSLIAGSGGTVTIAPSNGARSSTGGVTLMSSSYQAARFTVTCVPSPPLYLDCLVSLTYSISPVADTTLTSGGNSMTVDNFVPYSVNNSGSSTQGLLLPILASTDSLKVGARLTAGNNQAPGTYSGNFSVTVSFP